jgi:hypothetical protein
MELGAEVAKLADAADSKSAEVHSSCGFKSLLRHFSVVFMLWQIAMDKITGLEV